MFRFAFDTYSVRKCVGGCALPSEAGRAIRRCTHPPWVSACSAKKKGNKTKHMRLRQSRSKKLQSPAVSKKSVQSDFGKKNKFIFLVGANSACLIYLLILGACSWLRKNRFDEFGLVGIVFHLFCLFPICRSEAKPTDHLQEGRLRKSSMEIRLVAWRCFDLV